MLLETCQVQAYKKKSKLFKAKTDVQACQIFVFEKSVIFALIDTTTTDKHAALEYWTFFKVITLQEIIELNIKPILFLMTTLLYNNCTNFVVSVPPKDVNTGSAIVCGRNTWL